MESKRNKQKKNLSQYPLQELIHSADDVFNKHHFRKMIQSMDSLLNNSMFNFFPVDLYETDSELVIKADLPGVQKKQISLDVIGNQLRISVENKESIESKHDQYNYYRRERYFQKSERLIQLPYPIPESHVKASFKNGILEVRAPKQEKRSNDIRIE